MAKSLLPSSQWSQGSGPPFKLKVGHIEKAVGCLRLILVGFFSLIISCCLSCGGVVLIMKDQNPFAMFGVGIAVFVVVFWIISRLTSWRFKKAYGKTAVLDKDHLLINAGQANSREVIPYSEVTSVSIKKSRSQQLGYEFELANRTIHDLDPDLAMFPATNLPIENTVLPVVLGHWDRTLFEQRAGFVITPDATAAELRRACVFWIAVGLPLIFIPTWWGTMVDFFNRARKLYQQSKFCGESFIIQANGIGFQSASQAPIPLSDIRLTKQDDVAIVIESKIDGQKFMAPITARNAYTAGHWLFQKLRSGAFQSEQPTDGANDQGHAGGIQDLKSDLF